MIHRAREDDHRPIRVVVRPEIGAETPFWTDAGHLYDDLVEGMGLPVPLQLHIRRWCFDATNGAADDPLANEGLRLLEQVKHYAVYSSREADLRKTIGVVPEGFEAVTVVLHNLGWDGPNEGRWIANGQRDPWPVVNVIHQTGPVRIVDVPLLSAPVVAARLAECLAVATSQSSFVVQLFVSLLPEWTMSVTPDALDRLLRDVLADGHQALGNDLHNFFPTSREWIVVHPIDSAVTYIASNDEIQQRLLTDPGLEALALPAT